MGELEFLITKRYAPRELKKKHMRIAEAITPLLGKCTKEEFQKAKEGVETLLEKNHMNRRSLFSTLQSLGFEPADARQTPLFDVVPGLMPVRTIDGAWKMVADNIRLINKLIRIGARRGGIGSSLWSQAEEIATRYMFECSLYWDGRAAYSTYLFAGARSIANEIDKLKGPYEVPRRALEMLPRIKEEEEKNPNISCAELAKMLGAEEETIRALRIARVSRAYSVMDHDNVFYSGDGKEDSGASRVSYSQLDFSARPPSPEAEAMRNDRDRKIREALSSLPFKDASLVMGFLGVGAPRQDFEDLALEHGCSVATVRERIARVLRKLRNKHGEELSGLLQ